MGGGKLNAIYEQQRLRQQLGIPLTATVLLSVGEVNKNKNHAVCIKALAKLHQPNVYYVICGSGPLMQKNQQLARKLGITRQVVFAGYRQDVADFYKMADLFLFPSRREGLSLALMEAMANGLPVICSNIRGNRDLIQHQRGGYLVSANEVKQWQAAIKQGTDEENIWLKYGRYNQQRVKCSFSSSTVNEQLKKLYFSNY
ncbi:glycosyltransferase [Megasphaera elsdenii]|uniref:glycosyltransferase n=1 Tax=Megasphaera elsdenii TaxID=907 RepID=UPI0026DA78D4|nr:glycosyltransferase [Megasphaera elsdenii]